MSKGRDVVGEPTRKASSVCLLQISEGNHEHGRSVTCGNYVHMTNVEEDTGHVEGSLSVFVILVAQ